MPHMWWWVIRESSVESIVCLFYVSQTMGGIKVHRWLSEPWKGDVYSPLVTNSTVRRQLLRSRRRVEWVPFTVRTKYETGGRERERGRTGRRWGSRRNEWDEVVLWEVLRGVCMVRTRKVSRKREWKDDGKKVYRWSEWRNGKGQRQVRYEIASLKGTVGIYVLVVGALRDRRYGTRWKVIPRE